MTTHGVARRSVPMLIAFVLSAVANGAPPVAPSHWSKTPPLPTGCYSSRDSFAKDTDATIEALSADRTRQEEINTSIEDALKNLDPMEKQRRMQTYMMSNPQEAAKMMQATQAAGAEFQAAALAHSQRAVQLDEELKTLEAQYDAELHKAIAPLEAKIKALGLNDGEGGGSSWGDRTMEGVDREARRGVREGLRGVVDPVLAASWVAQALRGVVAGRRQRPSQRG